MMVKQAYMIIAHSEWPTLNLLLQTLDYEFNDVFLHIDKRVNPLPRLYEFKQAGFHVLQHRHAVYWGNYSQVETEYALFREAAKHGPYMMYHLLSGVDMPIKPQTEIYKFFCDNQDKNFVGIRRSQIDLQDLQNRWSYHYLFMSCNYRTRRYPAPLRLLLTAIRHSVVGIEKLLHIRRNTDIELVKCHQWVSLNQAGIEFILSKENEVCRRFKQTLCCDEVFVSTVLWNSPLRSTLYNTDDDMLGMMRCIDWQRGTPYTWQATDMEELLTSPYMFARKISRELADELKANLL